MKDASEWIRRASQGDREAFLSLVEGHMLPIYRSFSGKGLDRDTARNLTVETGMRAWHAAGLYRGDPSPDEWLLNIADDVLGSWKKKHSRMKREAEAAPEPSVRELLQEIRAGIEQETAQRSPLWLLKRFRFTILALIIAILVLLASHFGSGRSPKPAAAQTPPVSTGPVIPVDAALIPAQQP